jgi:hypothetical protein
MKRTYLILFLFILPVHLNGQTARKDAVVAPVKMNILYRGILNPVDIAVPGVKSDKVTATLTNGTIKKVSDGWVVTPGDQDLTVITILVNNKKVSEKSFRVKNIPEPVAVFAGKNNGNIPKEIASKTDILEADLPNFDLDLKFTIDSFVFLYSDGIYDIEISSNGNKLTDKMMYVIAQRKSGQNIVFKDIKAIGPDGRSRNLNPIVLTLK